MPKIKYNLSYWEEKIMDYKFDIEGNKGKRAFDLYPLALGFAVGIALSFVALAVSIHFI